MRASQCMEKGGVIEQPMRSVYLDETIPFASGEKRQDQENESVKTLLEACSRHEVRILLDFAEGGIKNTESRL